LKKLTVTMIVLVFSLVFAAQSFAAGMLGTNNGVGMSSTTSTDNTGSGSILGGNRGVGAGTTGTTGVTGTGMTGTSTILSTPLPTVTYGSYYGSSRIMSTPTTYGGTSSTSYNTNGTMRGYNYRTNATTSTTNNNWGWLGLLGLLGLVGLRRNNEEKHREHSGGKH
jgi:MYXO-CTERM domain-containing protein